jgi:hypothetical protein
MFHPFAAADRRQGVPAIGAADGAGNKRSRDQGCGQGDEPVRSDAAVGGAPRA